MNRNEIDEMNKVPPLDNPHDFSNMLAYQQVGEVPAIIRPMTMRTDTPFSFESSITRDDSVSGTYLGTIQTEPSSNQLIAESLLTLPSSINERESKTYDQLVRLQDFYRTDRKSIHSEIQNAKSNFGKAIWFHVWPTLKILRVKPDKFKDPDFAGDMYKLNPNIDGAIMMCEAYLKSIGFKFGVDSKTLKKKVTLWKRYNAVFKDTYQDLRTTIVDTIKKSFLKGKLCIVYFFKIILPQTNFISDLRKCAYNYESIDIETVTEEDIQDIDSFSSFMVYCAEKQKEGNLYYTFRADMVKEEKTMAYKMLVKKAFKYFLDAFVSKVIGHFRYKNESKSKIVSEFVTLADEAWAYIVLEANFANWRVWDEKKKEHSENSSGNSKFRMRPKFRVNKEARKDVFTKSTWDSRTACLYYNEAYRYISKERLSEGSQQFEMEYLQDKSKKVAGMKRPREYVEVNDEEDEVLQIEGMARV